LTIPVHPELQKIIDATPVGHLTLLTTRTGKAYEKNDLTDQFRRWREAAGLPELCLFHGSRLCSLCNDAHFMIAPLSQGCPRDARQLVASAVAKIL